MMHNLRCILFGHDFRGIRRKHHDCWEDDKYWRPIEHCNKCGLSKEELGIKHGGAKNE